MKKTYKKLNVVWSSIHSHVPHKRGTIRSMKKEPFRTVFRKWFSTYPKDDPFEAICKTVMDDDYYDPTLLSELLKKYQEKSASAEAMEAYIDVSNYYKMLSGERSHPTEVTLIKLCLYHKLDYSQSSEILSAAGYTIESTVSIPICVFRSFLKRQPFDPIYYDIDYYLAATEWYADQKGVEVATLY